MAQGEVVLNPLASTATYSKYAPPARIDPRGPLSAAVVVVAFVLWTLISEPAKPGSALPWTLNPTGHLYGFWYVLLYAVTIPAKELMNVLLGIVGRVLFGFRRMDEGEGVVRKLEVLETIDLCYLALNTMVEFIGMNHIVCFLISDRMETRLQAFSVMNGPAAFVLIMCVNDIIYYPFHLVAHKREFYPYCHKQHHRQFVPFRGYADAANQHPLEQAYGFCIFIASMQIAVKSVGLHAGTAWCCFLAWAILNIANHLAFDSRIHLPLPYPAYPRDHQMHHRFPQCNYSTLTSFCDRACGTFKPYRDLGKRITKDGARDDEDEAKEQSLQRPEAVPSAYSVAIVGLLIMAAAVAVEAFNAESPPEISALTSLLKPALVIVNAAVVCAAIEAAATATNTTRPNPGRISKLVEAVPPDGYKAAQGVWKAQRKPVKAD